MSHHWSAPRPWRRTGRDLPCTVCGRLVYRPAWQMRASGIVACGPVCLAAFRSKPATRLFSRWTRRSAYVFGLIVSDGHIRDGGCVSFTSRDKDLAEFVATALGSRATLRRHSRVPDPAFRVDLWSVGAVRRLAGA